MSRWIVRIFVFAVAVDMLACTRGDRPLSVGDAGTAAVTSTGGAAGDATGTGGIAGGGVDAADDTADADVDVDTGTGGIAGSADADDDTGTGGASPPGKPGEPCAQPTDCGSSFCVDGVCCEAACGGACQSCKLSGKVGTCSAVPAGASDPRGICVDQGAATCGTNGRCDGSGACRSYANGTRCSAATCVGDQLTTEGTCNAHGACVTAVFSCAPFDCRMDVPRCHSNCPTGDTICIPGFYCSGDEVCMPRKPGGAPGGRDHECVSLICAPAGDGGVSSCSSPP